MILISSNNSDSSTNEVIDWLLYFGKNFIRVNEDTKLKFGSYDLFKRTFSVCIQDDNQVYNLAFNDIKSYWYRRGTLSFSYEKISSNVEQNILSENLNLFLRYEIDSLVVFLNTKLKNIPTVIGHEKFNLLNKFECLEHAISVGLDVPKTRIASSRSELLEFHNSNKTEGNEVITKVLNVAINIPFDGGSLLSYTSVLDMENLNNFPELIFPTLLQEKLKKQFELRVFYLNEKTYTMAILSQNDPQTSVDFRNYNYEKPNRNPPFQLPQEIEDKIIKFMQILKLNCGSLDFVYTVDNKYVFLEVNPIGQFGMTSYPTNYYLEKLIAETL